MGADHTATDTDQGRIFNRLLADSAGLSGLSGILNYGKPNRWLAVAPWINTEISGSLCLDEAAGFICILRNTDFRGWLMSQAASLSHRAVISAVLFVPGSKVEENT